MERALNTIAWTHGFLVQAKSEGMTDDELSALERIISENPQAGDLVVGSGGCRKVRVARRGKGKSGGYRVVTIYAPPSMPVYVLAVLSKSARENFTGAEVAALAVLAKRIAAAHKR